MENQNSRLITYPSIEKSIGNYTVVLIDCESKDFIKLLEFLKLAKTDFDVYTYLGATSDLEWLSKVGETANAYLINDASLVQITPYSIRYGQNLEFTTPLEYFEKIEQQTVDKIVESLL